MEKYFLKIVPALACFLVIVSCSPAEIRVVHGNYSFLKGEYTQATVSYFKALETARYESVIYYNLGNLYHALGETESAIATLERASAVTEGEKGKELVFRSHFNLGLIYYELGMYEEAISNYIASLSVNPGDTEAKINLEFALKRLKQGQKEASTEIGESDRDSVGETYHRILQFIRRKEEDTWKSQNTVVPEESPEDW